MNTSNLHYHGFIDACAGYGLEKEAADALYKKAGWLGGTLRLLARGARRVGPAVVTRLRSAVTSPVSTAYSFINKHPVVSTLGGIGFGAYLGDSVDPEDRESVARMHMRTLTPSEKIMFDRHANGLGLPGLGLDPMYFKSSDPNSVLQHLRY